MIQKHIIKANDVKIYIICGTGEYGKAAVRVLGKERIICFCDSYKKGELDGIPIIGYEDLRSIYKRNMKVVVATKTGKSVYEIGKKLKEMHIPYDYIDNLSKNFFEHDRDEYIRLNKRSNFDYTEAYEYKMISDRSMDAGVLGSYFWQDLWAAQRIHEHPVDVHFDIGSRIDGFIAHLSSMGQKVAMIDIRPFPYAIPGVSFIQADATKLDTIEDNSIESLSALCSLEHFGLGRYGDPIDPEACFKCFDSIQRKMKSGGVVYISVPIGKEHLEFNAHRIFFASTIRDAFNKMDLVELSCACGVEYTENININEYNQEDDNRGNRFGLFRFRKRHII